MAKESVTVADALSEIETLISRLRDGSSCLHLIVLGMEPGHGMDKGAVAFVADTLE